METAEGFIGRAGAQASGAPAPSKVLRELQMVQYIVESLASLDPKARLRVLTYVHGVLEETN